MQVISTLLITLVITNSNSSSCGSWRKTSKYKFCTMHCHAFLLTMQPWLSDSCKSAPWQTAVKLMLSTVNNSSSLYDITEIKELTNSQPKIDLSKYFYKLFMGVWSGPLCCIESFIGSPHYHIVFSPGRTECKYTIWDPYLELFEMSDLKPLEFPMVSRGIPINLVLLKN